MEPGASGGGSSAVAQDCARRCSRTRAAIHASILPVLREGAHDVELRHAQPIRVWVTSTDASAGSRATLSTCKGRRRRQLWAYGSSRRSPDASRRNLTLLGVLADILTEVVNLALEPELGPNQKPNQKPNPRRTAADRRHKDLQTREAAPEGPRWLERRAGRTGRVQRQERPRDRQGNDDDFVGERVLGDDAYAAPRQGRPVARQGWNRTSDTMWGMQAAGCECPLGGPACDVPIGSARARRGACPRRAPRERSWTCHGARRVVSSLRMRRCVRARSAP